jgi:NADH-ubiquinone oxidoreductase chain 5
MNHAFFKALLFLSAGSVIHALSDEQDMRKMGGLARVLPLTYSMMMIGSLALIGFPFLTGFYSKDVILEVSYAKYTLHGNFAYWLGSLSALFTSYYSFRLLYLTFLAPTNAFKQSIKHVHDAPIIMAIPLILLAFGSIFVGYMAKDMMIGMGSPFWGNALFQLPENTLLIESEYIPQFVKMIPLIFSILGATIAYQINIKKPELAYSIKTSSLGNILYTFLNKRWLFDKVYTDFIGYPFLKMGYDITFKTIDKGLLEVVGPSGVMKLLGSKHPESFLSSVNKLQSGAIYHYAIVMLFGLTIFIAVIGLWDFISFWIESRIFFVHILTFTFLATYKN